MGTDVKIRTNQDTKQDFELKEIGRIKEELAKYLDEIDPLLKEGRKLEILQYGRRVSKYVRLDEIHCTGNDIMLFLRIECVPSNSYHSDDDSSHDFKVYIYNYKKKDIDDVLNLLINNMIRKKRVVKKVSETV